MEQKVSRRGLLGSSGSALMAGLVSPANERAEDRGSAPPTVQSAARPNLILFMPDKLRADALACYGNPITQPPNFDKLAQDGTRFTNCHVQYPVCGFLAWYQQLTNTPVTQPEPTGLSCQS